MKTNPFQLFKAMYLLLDNVWEQNQEEDLRIYLSDADPIFYENGQSIDPVVFEDFNNLYNKQSNSGMSDYDFVLFYLENLDPYYGDVKKYFIDISENDFESMLKSIL